jgi:hypothetical protein
MARRAATVSQVDLTRTMRAIAASGLKIVRVDVRPPGGGVVIETNQGEPVVLPAKSSEPKKRWAL